MNQQKQPGAQSDYQLDYPPDHQADFQAGYKSGYQPAQLLDALLSQLHLQNDGELSRRLHVAPRVLRHIREGTLPVGASMLIWMSEATGIPIPELRVMLGDRRRTCRVSFAKAPLRRRQAN